MALLIAACGAPPVTHAPATAPPGVLVLRHAGRPPVAVFARMGDPSSALSLALDTSELAAEGSVVAVALAALIEARVHGGEIIPDANGFRVRWLLANETDGARAADALRQALSDPLAGEWPAIAKKLGALKLLPQPDPGRIAAYACESRLVPSKQEPTASDVEGWRAHAFAGGRAAFAVVGNAAIGHAVADALARGPAWPEANPRAEPSLAHALSAFEDDANAKTASMLLVARIDPRVGPSVARALGDAGGPLAIRLRAQEQNLRAVSVTRHAGGAACLLVDMHGPRDPRSIARGIALAQYEMRIAAKQTGDVDDTLASDPRDAAEQLATQLLTSGASIDFALGPVMIGTNELVRATVEKELTVLGAAWERPAVEGGSRVEQGQPEVWMALASPCGTGGESDDDAGLSALVVTIAARQAHDPDATIESWVASDVVGLVGHAPARPHESSVAAIERLANVLASSLLALPSVDVAAAQGALLPLARPSLDVLARTLAPNHASWIVPTGTGAGLLRAAPSQVAARAEALRRGPLRAFVVANVDLAQAKHGLDALDRWIARVNEPRVCPSLPTAEAPKAGTYAVETDGTSEVYVAVRLDSATASTGEVMAAALDGDGGLLARALGDGLVRSTSARWLGAPRAPALVVHVEAPAGALDAAVAQVRALLERLRAGAFTEADLSRARAEINTRTTKDALDPRKRLMAAFRAAPTPPPTPPSLDAVRAAWASVQDSALVIVAARPRGRRP